MPPGTTTRGPRSPHPDRGGLAVHRDTDADRRREEVARMTTTSSQPKSETEIPDDPARNVDTAADGQPMSVTAGAADKAEIPTVNGAALDPAPDWAARFAPNHAKMIKDSAISKEVATARGYFTATKKVELRDIGFADYQRIVPALVVPVFGVTGEIVNYQIRPDMPRIPRSKNGKTPKPLKYESRGAAVKIIYLPSGEGGAKVGLDDFFAAGHTVDELLALATDKLREPIDDGPCDPSAPRGFILNDVGVHATTDDDDRPLFVCSPLHVLAHIRAEDSTAWGKLLEWADYDHVTHRWAMGIDELMGDSKEWLKRLASEGLCVGSSRRAKERLSDYIQLANPKERAICVTRPGWHNHAIVYPDETINPPDGEQIILQTTADFANGFKSSGTLDEWKSQVAQYCRKNPILIFGASTGFAAKLLHPVKVENGGFNLRGYSSLGKPTALQVAASVDGDGSEKGGFVEGWKATANGLESVCERHNDSILPLDELAQCDPHVAAEAAYLIANGQGKGRMTRYVTARRRASWRTLFISSGEISLSAHIAQIGRRVRAGQEVRLLDIPVGERQFGVFDNLHTFPSGQKFANNLKLSASRYYGTAGREFVRLLTAEDSDFSATQTAWGKFLPYFIDKALTEEQDGEQNKIEVSSEVTRAATRFALVAFAAKWLRLMG